MVCRVVSLLALFACFTPVAAPGAEEEAYFLVWPTNIEMEEGQWPPALLSGGDWGAQAKAAAMQPYVVLDGEGEAYLNDRDELMIRLPRKRDVAGWMVVPKDDLSGMSRLRFRVPASAARASAREAFFQRAAAVLAAVQAENLGKFVGGEIAKEVEHPKKLTGMGQVWLSPRGARSSTYGTLEFLTPIAELEISHVTAAEWQAYETWRNGYERSWRRVFDPIAVQLSATKGKLSADVSVLPITVDSDYQFYVDLVGQATIGPGDGDPHPEALFQLLLPVDMNANRFIRGSATAPALFTELLDHRRQLDWFNGDLAVYIDDDPLLAELAGSPDAWQAWQDRRFQFPVAVWLGSHDDERMREMVGWVKWGIQLRLQTVLAKASVRHKKYGRQSYLRITGAWNKGDPTFEVYVATLPGGLLVTLSEPMMRRAIERRLAQRGILTEPMDAEPLPRPLAPPEPMPDLGDHLLARVQPAGVQAVEQLFQRDYQAVLQARAWGNLPILNEWKRMYPDEDPLALHERYWGVKLVCPGGGTYVWNDEWRTMESTVFGHPGRPATPDAGQASILGFDDASFGLTFERFGPLSRDIGLRARVELARER